MHLKAPGAILTTVWKHAHCFLVSQKGRSFYAHLLGNVVLFSTTHAAGSEELNLGKLHYPAFTAPHLLTTLLTTWHLLAGVLCWQLCRCCTYAELFYPATISPLWLSSTATFINTAAVLRPSGRSMRRTAVSFCHVLLSLRAVYLIHSLPHTRARAWRDACKNQVSRAYTCVCQTDVTIVIECQ